MGLKIFTVLLVLFIAELTFLATKDPKDLSFQEKDIATADLSFDNLKGISITKQGVKSKLEAKKVKKFKDDQILYGIKVYHKDGNLTHNIQAKRAIHKDSKITFKNSVKYKNSQNLHIFTQNLEYNISNKKIIVNSPFTLSKDESKLNGETLIYDTKLKKLSVDKPHFFQKVDR